MNEYYDYGKCCMKKGGIWKLAAVIFFFAFIAMAMASLCLKKKNKEYCDTIVTMSENFPNTEEQEEKLSEIRKRKWSKAHSLFNRKSDEERIAENRIIEED